MMLGRLRSLRRDESGATLVETAIIFPMVLILTFGLMEFGHALWQYQAAEKATQVGARWLATRHGVRGEGAALTTELYTTVVPDCFVANPNPSVPGTACGSVAGATAWTQTCAGAGGGACSAAVMAGLLAQMQQYAPFIQAANVSVQLRGSTMGYLGRGRAVPHVTVRTTGLTYSFITLDALLGLGAISMPGFDATSVAEDQREGPAS